MPYFQVLTYESGTVEIRGPETAVPETEKPPAGATILGEFHAENENEAWRQFGTLNTNVDMEKHKVMVSADPEAVKAVEEAAAAAVAEAVGTLELPADTGAVPEEEEEVVPPEVPPPAR